MFVFSQPNDKKSTQDIFYEQYEHGFVKIQSFADLPRLLLTE